RRERCAPFALGLIENLANGCLVLCHGLSSETFSGGGALPLCAGRAASPVEIVVISALRRPFPRASRRSGPCCSRARRGFPRCARRGAATASPRRGCPTA